LRSPRECVRDHFKPPKERSIVASNMRMRIAAGATVLGLGGLAGYALGSNDGQQAHAGSATAEGFPKPKVHTQVVHRTIHVRPKGKTEKVGGADAGSSGGSGSSNPVSAPVVNSTPAPAATPSYASPSTGTSGSSSSGGPATAPPSTHSSGGGSGSSYSDDGGGEGGEHESEGGDD
jgi:hypothetical protein